MKEYIKKFACIILAATISLFLISCGSSSDTEVVEEVPDEESTEITMEDVNEMAESEEEDYDNGIYFDEEEDGAEVVTAKKDPSAFVGKWKATSGQSMYQFGNVDIEVKADGTWSGNISDEDLKGSWKEEGDGIYLTSDLFEFSLTFTDNDVLVMQHTPDDGSGEVITTVLSKQ